MRTYPDFSKLDDPDDDPLVIHRHGDAYGRALIIFIHGLGGTRYGTWSPKGQDPRKVGFPKFIHEDIPALDVGLYAYRTAFGRLKWWRSIELEDEAKVLADRIRDCAGIYPYIMLAGHSLGGILARTAVHELIDRDDGRTLASVRALFMLASPMAGSLRVLSFLSSLSADMRALRPHGPLVKKTADAFTDRVVVFDKQKTKPNQFVIPAWVVTGAEDNWVDRFSAGLGIPRDQINNVRGSHTSVVKPRSKTDDVYRWLQNIMAGIVDTVAPVPSPPRPKPGRLAEHLRFLRQKYETAMASRLQRAGPLESAYEDMLVRPVTVDDTKPDSHRLAEAPTRLAAVIGAPAVRAVLFGSGGLGKTTALLRLAFEGALRASSDENAPVPLYVDLRGFRNDGGRDLLLKVIADASPLFLDAAELNAYLKNNSRSVLFLFDAFNEVPRKLRRGCRDAIEAIHDARHAYLIASRWNDDVDVLAHAGWQPLELLGLEPEQWKRILERRGAVDAVEQLPKTLTSLLRNPFHVQALAAAVSEDGEVLRNRSQLYRRFVRAWIRRETQYERHFDFAAVKAPVLTWIANRMTERGETRLEVDEDVRRRLVALVKDIEIKHPGQEIIPTEFRLEDLLDELVNEGLVEREESAMEFMHHTVQEYFTAVAYADLPVSTLAERIPELVWRQVSPEYGLPKLETDSTIEAVILAAGLLTDAAPLVRELNSRHPLAAAACLDGAHVDAETYSVMTAAWLDLLGRSHPRDQWIACGCLARAHITTPFATERLLDIWMRGGWGLSYAAEQALSTMAPEDVVDRLLRRAFAWDDAGVEARMYGLKKILRSILRATGPDRIREFSRYIGTERATRIAERIIGINERDANWDDEPRPITAAALQRMFSAFQQEVDEERVAVAGILVRASLSDLMEALNRPGPGARIAAVRELATRGVKDAAPQLIESALAWGDNATIVPIAEALVQLLGADNAVKLVADRLWRRAPTVILVVAEDEARQLDSGTVPPSLIARFRVRYDVPSDPDAVPGARGWTVPRRGSDNPEISIHNTDAGWQVLMVGREDNLVGLLEAMPAQSALPVLRECLRDERTSVCARAIHVVATLDGTAATTIIASLLENATTPDVAQAAIDALARFGSATAIRPLVRSLAGIHAYWSARDFEVETAWGSSRAPAHSESIHAVLRKLDAGPLAAAALSDALGCPSATGRSSVVREIRRWLAEATRNVDEYKVWVDLVTRLREAVITDPDYGVRRECAVALKWSRGNAHIQALMGDLKTDVEQRIERAVTALGFIDDALAVEPLREAMANGSERIRLAAAAALKRMHAGVEAEMAQVLTKPIDDAFAAGDYEEVLRLASLEADVLPFEGLPHLIRGIALNALARPALALEALRHARSVDPFQAIEEYEAQALFALGRHSEAVEAARLWSTKREQDANAAANLGWYAYLARYDDEAVAASQRALSLKPDHIFAAFNLGLVHLRAGRVDAAAEGYTKALAIAEQLNPNAAVEACRAALKDLEVLRETVSVDKAALESEYQRLQLKLAGIVA